MKHMVMLVIALGVLAATPAAAQVRVSGYIVVAVPSGLAASKWSGRIGITALRGSRWYRAYRPIVEVERLARLPPASPRVRREWRGRGW